MQKYSLAAMARRNSGRALMPIIQESAGFERSYRAAVRRLLTKAARAIRETVIPEFDRERLRVGDQIAIRDELSFDQFKALLAMFSRDTEGRVQELIDLEAQRHTDKFMENARRAFEVDLRGVITKEDLREHLNALGQRNVALITGLTNDLARRVQAATLETLISGETVGKLRERIKKDLKATDSRAALIAADQTNKLNADMNRIRHMQAGITKYSWLTSQDERVRPLHASLDGREYKYGEPTGAEEGLPPGKPIRCRCIAQAIVEF